jgi:hypothetical protein
MFVLFINIGGIVDHHCLSFRFKIERSFYLVRPSRSWSYGSCIYNYLCNQYLSLLKLLVRIPPRRGVLDTTLSDKVCQWFAAGQWYSPGTTVFSTNKTDHHDITEILLKVALNTIIALCLVYCILLCLHNICTCTKIYQNKNVDCSTSH